MNETELRKHRCCFTGHRPEKLNISEQQLHPLLEQAIQQAIQNGFTTFITGMAKGTDLIAAEIVLERRRENPHIRLIAPCPTLTLDSTGATDGRNGSRMF